MKGINIWLLFGTVVMIIVIALIFAIAAYSGKLQIPVPKIG